MLTIYRPHSANKISWVDHISHHVSKAKVGGVCLRCGTSHDRHYPLRLLLISTGLFGAEYIPGLRSLFLGTPFLGKPRSLRSFSRLSDSLQQLLVMPALCTLGYACSNRSGVEPASRHTYSTKTITGRNGTGEELALRICGYSALTLIRAQCVFESVCPSHPEFASLQ